MKKSPFNITCDPEVFFESRSHREAFASLLYGINEKKGIILVAGEVGTGKTTLCKLLVGRLAAQIKTSLVLNPYFSELQLLRIIVEDFGVKIEEKNRLGMVSALNSFLIDINSQGGNAVLIIDEAQNLSVRQLEQIRLLSNLETSRDKLLQIVLVGQPELTEKLARFDLRQIYQRIFVKYNLSPLREEEVKDYVEFRLKKFREEDVIIAEDSYKIIYEFSKGVPRLINMLCDRILLLGFVKDKRVFNEEDFSRCVAEVK